MSTQEDTTPARAAMERLGVSPTDIVNGVTVSMMSVNRMLLGVRMVRRSTAEKFAAYEGFTDEERGAIMAQDNVMQSRTGNPQCRTASPDSPGWAALTRIGLTVADMVRETGISNRSVYRALNGTAGVPPLVRFLGHPRLTDTERVAIVEAHGYSPYTVLGRLVGLSAEWGQPMTTIVRGQG